MKPFKLIIFILILSGCSTHTSPRQAPKGEQFMFVTNNEEDIFRWTKGRSCTNINRGPVNGGRSGLGLSFSTQLSLCIIGMRCSRDIAANSSVVNIRDAASEMAFCDTSSVNS